MSEIQAILFDVGGTLVDEAPPGTPVDQLEVRFHRDVRRDLETLARGFRLGAVTDTTVMTEADVRALLGPGGVSDLLDVVVTSVDVGAAKPDPRGLLAAAHKLGVEITRVLYVGDQDIDEQAAAAAGMQFARVTGDRTVAEVVREWLRATQGPFAAACATVAALDQEAMAAAAEHHDRLTKPRGALGHLEHLGITLAGIAGQVPPPVPSPAAVAIFAGDHGVHAEGVTPWPQQVTAQMVANFLAGGAAINVLARQTATRVVVVDVGVASQLDPAPGLLTRKIRPGTANLAIGPAMTRAEALAALDVGADVAAMLVADGARCLVTGDMGIANTTPSAALITALTGRAAVEVTGRGTGIDDTMLAVKQTVVERAVQRAVAAGMLDDPIALLAEIGGLEIAALAGFIVSGAAERVPVIIDGVIAAAALLVADQLAPDTLGACIAGHRSAEPGATAVLEHLLLRPLLELDLRLGEGSGACLALPIVEAAAHVLAEMATFDSAGVTHKDSR